MVQDIMKSTVQTFTTVPRLAKPLFHSEQSGIDTGSHPGTQLTCELQKVAHMPAPSALYHIGGDPLSQIYFFSQINPRPQGRYHNPTPGSSSRFSKKAALNPGSLFCTVFKHLMDSRHTQKFNGNFDLFPWSLLPS